MRKSKGMRKMAKGGTKMMRARGGKMAKGYAKGGSKMMKAQMGNMVTRPMNAGRMGTGTRARPMGAMKGKMAKGYAKGGAKMMKANKGKMAYDGPNKAASMAKDRLLAKTKKLREQARKLGFKVVKKK
jgi:hypothetical protein